ncbi:DUF1800 family protein [Marinigracilibium pacificum]|uniref:DUF1800 domain-containing protein n=1 Tax=Marinigracilibium pacificum TaxID=2729599 RepID=A0A848IX10_9BACT|nr:DUF1800 family protein [Marinigracilibium pacificum]NMM48196.1 DUF1800 domain-containing protein [Marinigracilibium pacificum]
MALTPASGTLGLRRAELLLRRTTFCPSREDINFFAGLSVSQALDTLFNFDQTLPEPPIDPQTGTEWMTSGATDANSEGFLRTRYFFAWQMNLMLKSNRSIQEKLVWFWHTHWTTSQQKVTNERALYFQNQLFRYYAAGSFKDLSRKMCLDNAMLLFLDGRLNIDGVVNENFARELLELYTVGKGPQDAEDSYTYYSETDIQAAAKILTGYSNDDQFSNLDPDTGLPMGIIRGGGDACFQHTIGDKTFSDIYGNATITTNPAEIVDSTGVTADGMYSELDDLIELIFSQPIVNGTPRAAQFICAELYRYFVHHEITGFDDDNYGPGTIMTDIIEPMAQVLVNNDYNIESALRALLGSTYFLDTDNSSDDSDIVGGMIKSPLEITLGSLKLFNISLPEYETDLQGFYDSMLRGVHGVLERQGLPFYKPFEVAGYPAHHQTPTFDKSWITPNYLANRYNFTSVLFNPGGEDDPPFRLDVLDFIENPANGITNPGDGQLLVTQLIDLLFPESVCAERIDYFVNEILYGGLSTGATMWQNDWNAYKSGGDPVAVVTQLEKLITALIQTPEFQLN